MKQYEEIILNAKREIEATEATDKV